MIWRLARTDTSSVISRRNRDWRNVTSGLAASVATQSPVLRLPDACSDCVVLPAEACMQDWMAG